MAVQPWLLTRCIGPVFRDQVEWAACETFPVDQIEVVSMRLQVYAAIEHVDAVVGIVRSQTAMA